MKKRCFRFYSVTFSISIRSASGWQFHWWFLNF
jgi:hypothetical protein